MFRVFGTSELEGQIDDRIIRMQCDAACEKTFELLVTGPEPSKRFVEFVHSVHEGSFV